MTIYPVVLCGGSGTRLWPVSRQTFPKQFAEVLGTTTLFEQTIARVRGQGFADPLVVTSDDHRFLARGQLDATPATILTEPSARGTASAALAAALWLQRQDPEAVMLLLPSDHLIPDVPEFQATVQNAIPTVQQGRIVCLGVVPTRAETGFGWIEPYGNALPSDTPVPVKRFIEKPDADHAERLLSSEQFLWNAGIFMFTAQTLVQAFLRHAAYLTGPVADGVKAAEVSSEYVRLDNTHWARARDISLDHAIMEHTDKLSVLPYRYPWSDLGSWEAVWQNATPDQLGNVVSGNSSAIRCRDTLLRSEQGGPELVGIGLENMIVVSMSDAVLVMPRTEAQDVKEAVSILKQRQRRPATECVQERRPWGEYDRLAEGPRFTVKRITVDPGGCLSLQSHVHRAEHWIVVQGTAQVTIGDERKLVAENQSVYVPLGETHRLENPGKLPLILIEVQTGSYLGEDDIVRYEDVYQRA